MQPYNGDMQRSAQINANYVFILIQEKSSSKLHFSWILDSNCAQRHMSWTGCTWAGELVIFSSCKIPTPSSLSSRLVTGSQSTTGSQSKAWQAQSLLL